jgi:hypothetical protein
LCRVSHVTCRRMLCAARVNVRLLGVVIDPNSRVCGTVLHFVAPASLMLVSMAS